MSVILHKFHKLNQRGVTLVELMIATTIFSVVLVIIIFAFLFISKDYVKGTVAAQTQEAARAAIEQMSQDIQLNNATVTPTIKPAADGTSSGLCIGDHRYSFQLNKELGNTATRGLIVDNDPGCDASYSAQSFDPSVALSSSSKELLSNHMRLGSFSVTPTNLVPGQYTISITIAYGDDTTQSSGPLKILAANPYTYQCGSFNLGGNFCAVTTLTTVVQERVVNGG